MTLEKKNYLKAEICAKSPTTVLENKIPARRLRERTHSAADVEYRRRDKKCVKAILIAIITIVTIILIYL